MGIHNKQGFLINRKMLHFFINHSHTVSVLIDFYGVFSAYLLLPERNK